jgi:hypothetical protein
MAIVEHPLQALQKYLPANSFTYVVHYINLYKIHLTVTKKRKTILGDYRHPFMGKNHRITINGDLNVYEFLITFLHELAHLQIFEQFGNRVEAHGNEWKFAYAKLLQQFIELKIFPEDIQLALQKTIHNPAATASGETHLLKVLRKYNKPKSVNHITIEQLPIGSFFKTDKGMVFKKGLLRRKRYECLQISTGRLYAFSPIAEVVKVEHG